MSEQAVIKKLTHKDYRALAAMKTGIEDDYVVRIFPRLLEHDVAYGNFVDGKLVSVAAYTIYGGEFAVLGRLRTDLRYRGQGLSTNTLKKICAELKERSDIRWVGLTTRLENKRVHHIAGSLGMDLLSTILSCTLKESGMALLENRRQEDKEEWVEIKNNADKKACLQKLTATEKNHLKAFPYASYYPLPFNEKLWEEDYLSQCKFWGRGDRFVSLMPDDKGNHYYHMKYFWDDIFSVPGLWPKMIDEAKKEERTLWVDLPPHAFSSLPKARELFDCATWTLFGKYDYTS